MVQYPGMHYLSSFAPVTYPSAGFGLFFLFLAVATVWTLILKGFALWHAARGSQKWWFVAILLINTLGILEIVYLVWFRPEASSKKEVPAEHVSEEA